MKRVVISGAYGYGNIGDEAILKGMLLALREAIPDADFVVLSRNPELTQKQHGVRAIHRVLFLPSLRQMVRFGLSRAGRAQTLAWIRHLRQADVLIVGGGGLLYDRVNTTKAKWLEKLYLFGWPISHWALEIGVARALGKPVILYSVGVGPVTTRLGRRLLKRIAEWSSLITVRDEVSRTVLSECGVPVNQVQVSADPAILLSPASCEDVSQLLIQGKLSGQERSRIALALRSWYPYAMTDKAAAIRRQDEWERSVAEAADRLIELLDAELVFVPMQDYGEPFNDTNCAGRIIARMKHPERAHCLSPGLDPEVVMGVLATTDLVVAMRLHALILASAVSTPAVGIIYDPKVKGFLDSIGQSDAGLNVDNLSSETLVARVRSVWARREILRARMAERVEHLRAQARRNAHLVAQLLTTQNG